MEKETSTDEAEEVEKETSTDEAEEAKKETASEAEKPKTKKKKAPAESRDGVQYQRRRNTQQDNITKDFEKTVDEILSGNHKGTDAVLAGYTPDIFREIGVPSLPLVMGVGHIYSSAKTEAEAKSDNKYNRRTHYHGLGEAKIKEIYKRISSPELIISSKDLIKEFPVRSMQSVVAIVNLGTAEKPLMIPVQITTERTVNGQAMDVNMIASIYEKDVTGLIKEAVAQENSGDVGIFYIKKAAKNMEAVKGLIPKAAHHISGSGYILHDVSEKVNLKVKEQTQTIQFAKWFGDWQNHPENASKVVNSDGTPKVLYHQTGAEFTEFEPMRPGAGETDSETPHGIFMKPTNEDIGIPGSLQMELYASIKNPLVVQNREQLNAWYKIKWRKWR